MTCSGIDPGVRCARGDDVLYRAGKFIGRHRIAAAIAATALVAVTMYFGTSPIFRGGHESAGVTATSTNWLLAEGATGAGFETFILVANPGSEAAEVTFTFLPENGVPASIVRTVGAASRITINPEREKDDALPGFTVGADGDADQRDEAGDRGTRAVLAARPGRMDGSAQQLGVTHAATRWGLAGGAGGPESYQTCPRGPNLRSGPISTAC